MKPHVQLVWQPGAEGQHVQNSTAFRIYEEKTKNGTNSQSHQQSRIIDSRSWWSRDNECPFLWRYPPTLGQQRGVELRGGALELKVPLALTQGAAASGTELLRSEDRNAHVRAMRACVRACVRVTGRVEACLRNFIDAKPLMPQSKTWPTARIVSTSQRAVILGLHLRIHGTRSIGGTMPLSITYLQQV